MDNFENDMPPKEIIACAMTEIAEFMKPDGFNYIKSKLEIRKVFDFMVSISPQINRNNRAGITAQALLKCSISDRRGKECFWSKGLAISNKKQDFSLVGFLWGRAVQTINDGNKRDSFPTLFTIYTTNGV